MTEERSVNSSVWMDAGSEANQILSPTIVIPKLTSGNFGSVVRMLELAGANGVISDDPDSLLGADAVIIAGVGAFDAGMTDLRAGGWIPALEELRRKNSSPILGICLGMQMLCESSAEGQLEGLGWFSGRLERLTPDQSSNLKVPNMGWRDVSIVKENEILPKTQTSSFYFVHSYALRKIDDPSQILMTSEHDGEFIAGMQRERLVGVQFHPEKSHNHGRKFIKGFVEMVCSASA